MINLVLEFRVPSMEDFCRPYKFFKISICILRKAHVNLLEFIVFHDFIPINGGSGMPFRTLLPLIITNNLAEERFLIRWLYSLMQNQV